MTAKKMFEKLGYKQNVQDDFIEYYIEDMNYPVGHYPYIIFNKKHKWWHSNLAGTTDEEDFAINKQIEELGWNNEIQN